MNIIKVLIADDHTLFRKGLKLLLSKDPRIEVIGEAVDGLETLKLAEALRPDVIMLDIDMPKLKGDQVLKNLKKDNNEAKVVVLSMHDEERYISDLVQNGANAYLLKNEDPNIVRMAVKSCHDEGNYFNQRTIKAMQRIISEEISTDITPQEKEVLKYICDELTTKEIAEKMDLSVKTIEVYRKNILQKTNSKNVAGIVRFAFKNNLL